MRAHIIKNGCVVNTIEVASLSFMPGLVDASQGGSIGDAWDGSKYSKPAPTPAPVPEILTPRQFRQALNHFTFRATVEGAIAAADQDTKDWYEFAMQFERHHPIVVAMAQAMGFTSGQMDQVWTYGAGL